MSTYLLDARNLLCPLPVIRTQQKIASLTPKDLLEVICTDPGVRHDIPAWCRINGHYVHNIIEKDNEIRVYIEVGNNT
ncbi:sulfurtransferase TusA family protein [Candidatus Nitrosacidococcus tergens]|uniref:Sulfurtransferase TusA homolog n=1 Tax=Candidatus Nitrosacidococcus tergens TaxID=553981 RepID=A0A7G1QBC5_9GAMM|nr:sulfurtransferase TusA family protein [Candidatus Nitrosacidococcus tergens]CAB1277108.1 Sulfurtransferase TusA homolog [Candidatus Nitrosacidococcus tergens]